MTQPQTQTLTQTQLQTHTQTVENDIRWIHVFIKNGKCRERNIPKQHQKGGSQWARDVRKSVQAYMKGPYETVGRRERKLKQRDQVEHHWEGRFPSSSTGGANQPPQMAASSNYADRSCRAAVISSRHPAVVDVFECVRLSWCASDRAVCVSCVFLHVPVRVCVRPNA